MAKSDTGKVIAIIGAFIGILAVLLCLLVEDLAWWQIYGEWGAINATGFLNSFGYTSNTLNSDSDFVDGGGILIIGSVLILLCSIALTYTAVKEEKGISILCAIGIIAGLIVFCYGMTLNQDLDDAFSFADQFFSASGNIFFGSTTVLGWNISWRMGNGFILGAIGGIISIVGAAIMD